MRPNNLPIGKALACPFCAMPPRKFMRGVNDFATVHPKIAAQWSPQNPTHPSSVFPSSKEKVAWVCDYGHEWTATVVQRSQGSGCPKCRHARPRGDSFADKYPQLSGEWSTKNRLSPSDYKPASNQRVWWACPKGHEYQAPMSRRGAGGTGCPYCAGKRALPGYNTLSFRHPLLAEEWLHGRNGGMTPDSLTPGSGFMAWWKCSKCQNEWRAQVAGRTGRGDGCPGCSGNMLVKGVNDIATVRPELVKDWHSERNAPLTPSDITRSSAAKVWWKCEGGHEWQAAPYNRARHGCPKCVGRVSKKETEVAAHIQSLGLEILTSDRATIGKELDILVPSRNLAVEFNGLYWHSSAHKARNFHKEKTDLCAVQGIQLIHIWEDDWRDRQEVVKRLIARKLGVSNEPRLNARALSVSSATVAEAKAFMRANHIQGFGAGSAHLALRSADSRVRALLTVKKRSNGQHEIVRFATDTIVRGGFSRLMKHAEGELLVQEWVTFADRGVSDGNLYESLGFRVDGDIAPDYMYVVNGERKHKFGYRLKRFRDDPELEYREGMTESQLAELNNLPRIYDAGKVRYVKSVM